MKSFGVKSIFMVVFMVVMSFSMASAASNKATKSLIAVLTKEVEANGDLTPKAKAFVSKNLIGEINNKVFIKSTESQNSKKVPLGQIQKIDKQWIAAEEEMPLQKELQTNTCASEIKKLTKKHPAVLEAFVMDNQGAVVCENTLTSDYWQGDEAKWKNSYKGGKGGLDVGKSSFDKSANATIQQISLPVVDDKGKVIGAITYGVVVDKL